LLRIQNSLPEVHCAYITVGTTQTESELYQDIADALFPEAAFDISSEECAWREFRRFLTQHVAQQQNIIVLDEFDSIHDFINPE